MLNIILSGASLCNFHLINERLNDITAAPRVIVGALYEGAVGVHGGAPLPHTCGHSQDFDLDKCGMSILVVPGNKWFAPPASHSMPMYPWVVPQTPPMLASAPASSAIHASLGEAQPSHRTGPYTQGTQSSMSVDYPKGDTRRNGWTSGF